MLDRQTNGWMNGISEDRGTVFCVKIDHFNYHSLLFDVSGMKWKLCIVTHITFAVLRKPDQRSAPYKLVFL